MYGGYRQIGRTGILAMEAAVNQALSVLPPSSAFSSKFVQHFLNGHVRLWRRFAGSSRKDPNITGQDVRHFLVPSPPLPEQQKIASILSAWDETIEQTRKLIDTRKRRRKGLMQQLLTGKKRLPSFASPAVQQETPLGETPSDWPLKKLSDVFEKIRRKNDTDEDVVLTASGENGLVDQRTYFTKSVAGQNRSGYYLLLRGEFAYNRSAMAGYPYGAIKRLDLYDAGILSTLYSCFALRHEGCVSDFFVYVFEAGLLNRQLRHIAQVGGRAHGLLNVTDSDFYAVKVAVPSKDEQEAIAAVLQAADEEISHLESQLKALEKQKRGLMQKLLTGTVRVKV